LVKEKRQTRLDFIRTVTKAFDVDSTKLSATHDEVQFVRFVVENLSAFDYKTQEEVLAVIRAVTNVLSVSGMQMMEILAPSDLMRQLDSVPASQVGNIPGKANCGLTFAQDQPMAQPLEDTSKSGEILHVYVRVMLTSRASLCSILRAVFHGPCFCHSGHVAATQVAPQDCI
jgi:hypothetical protein